ncbi:hypothetical protein V2S66_03400 [Streptomyces sp. V4-01]|uniref:Uncharacterized protein n=1 Tax=Actinacidiphila polyblastidii TaxID=3110430 RepID=A0ABU7P5E1_9ACTN|nr:hypothetical protein [Streptomyces sp. V4-01]
MQATDPAPTQPSPAPTIGTPAEQSTHREPAPTPAEHVAAFRQQRPGDCVTDH